MPFPKAGRNVTSPQLRDTELVQWVADFISAMFDVDKVDVTGDDPGKPAPKDKKNVISVGQ